MKQCYEIVIHGLLPTRWNIIFEGLNVHPLADGNTRITGSLPDQSALYGLLMQLRDFGLTLISLSQIKEKE